MGLSSLAQRRSGGITSISLKTQQDVVLGSLLYLTLLEQGARTRWKQERRSLPAGSFVILFSTLYEFTSCTDCLQFSFLTV